MTFVKMSTLTKFENDRLLVFLRDRRFAPAFRKHYLDNFPHLRLITSPQHFAVRRIRDAVTALQHRLRVEVDQVCLLALQAHAEGFNANSSSALQTPSQLALALN